MHFLALRFWLAIIILFPFGIKWLKTLYSDSTNNIQLHKENSTDIIVFLKNCFPGILVGMLLFAGFALQTLGMRYTTASRSGFFTGLLVIITPVIAHIFRTSYTPMLIMFGIPFAFFGVYLMADPQMGGLNIGDILTIACAVVFSFQMITLEVVAKKFRSAWALTYLQLLTVGVFSLIWCLLESQSFHFSFSGLLSVLYTGLLGTIAAVWLQTRYQPETSAGHAALIFTLEPVFAALFAWFLLGETWTGRGIFGAALILLAMVWSSVVVYRTKISNQV